MNTVHDYSTISCCCALEWLSSNGTVKKSVKTKTGQLTIMRNEFRDLFVALASKETNQRFPLQGVIIHKKFANEGKATLKFPDIPLNLFISNAAPAQLTLFLKAMFVKITSAKSSPKVPLRDRLLSVKDKTVEEISPLSSKDAQRYKKTMQADGLKKRLREDDIKSQKGPEVSVLLI